MRHKADRTGKPQDVIRYPTSRRVSVSSSGVANVGIKFTGISETQDASAAINEGYGKISAPKPSGNKIHLRQNYWARLTEVAVQK